MKIALLGYSGSGKSTLAKKLSNYYDIPALFLDTVNFSTNWELRNQDECLSIIKTFMDQPGWVIDGNYQKFNQEQRLQVADQIILLEFPRRICFFRAFHRYLQNRHTTRSDMAAGCIEKFDLEFMWWILYEGRNKQTRQHYQQIKKQYKDKIIVLKKPKDTETFLKQLNK